MDKISELQRIIYANTDELSLIAVLFNLLGAMIVSFVVRQFYFSYSSSLTGKAHIASILPILTGIIFLIIVVVKTSLALSLGLVGALSIVRFRTPIKEPEELIYLFLAIAIGLGFGAGYPIITILVVLIILIIIYFFLSNKNSKSSEYNLVINWNGDKITQEIIKNTLTELSTSLKLVRYENGPEVNSAVFLLDIKQGKNIDTVINSLKNIDKNISITFFESKVNW